MLVIERLHTSVIARQTTEDFVPPSHLHTSQKKHRHIPAFMEFLSIYNTPCRRRFMQDTRYMILLISSMCDPWQIICRFGFVHFLLEFSPNHLKERKKERIQFRHHDDQQQPQQRRGASSPLSMHVCESKPRPAKASGFPRSHATCHD